MKTFYLIRQGWNGANQSSMRRPANPRTSFDSGFLSLVGIVEADSGEDALKQFSGTVYNGQHLWATANPREVRGLTQAVREFHS